MGCINIYSITEINRQNVKGKNKPYVNTSVGSKVFDFSSAVCGGEYSL